MKTLTMNQLDEINKEIADTLISLGQSRPTDRTLTCLSKVNEAKSIEGHD